MSKFDSTTKLIFLAHSIFWFSQTLIQPFLSIFFINELKNVSLTEIGTSTLIFYLASGATMPLFSYLEEKTRGLKDETLFVVSGYILRGVSFIIFTFSSDVWDLYIFQLFLGLANAMYSAADKTVLANVSQKRNGSGAFLWGTDDSIVIFSAAIGALLGGHLTSVYGIRIVLMVNGILTMISGLVYYGVTRKLKKEKIWKGF